MPQRAACRNRTDDLFITSENQGLGDLRRHGPEVPSTCADRTPKGAEGHRGAWQQSPPGSPPWIQPQKIRLNPRDQTPRQLRRSPAPTPSDSGEATDQVALLAGHSSPGATDAARRRHLRPVPQTAATATDGIFPANVPEDQPHAEGSIWRGRLRCVAWTG
jgi:hypothetical protein